MVNTFDQGPWPEGIDNRSRDYAVPPTRLRNAVNVDIDTFGRVRTRQGLTKLLSAPGGHSLYSCPLGTYFNHAGQLKKINADNSTTILGNIGNTYTAFNYFNNEIYYSTETQIGKILSDGVTLGTWGVTSPAFDITLFDTSNFDKYPEIYGPPLPCRIIRSFAGRLWMAKDNVLWYTEPYALDRVKYQRNFIQFTSDIQVLEPVSGGIWVATIEETVFLQGLNPDEMILINQLNYGGVFNTSRPIPNSNDVIWRSTRGVVLATQDGQIQNLQEDKVAVNPANTGAAIVIEKDGLRQYLSTAVPTGTTPMQSSSWAAAEIIRKS